MEQLENKRVEYLELAETLLENKVYRDCEFYKCRFLATQIKNCSFTNCTFSNCIFSRVTFKFTNMHNCELNDSMFIGISWSDVKSKRGFNKPIYAIKNSVFQYNNFFEFNFQKFDFTGSSFLESYFENCNLEKANFQQVNLGGTRFIKSNLTKADFRDARDYIITLQDNKLKGAKFSFPNVVELLRTLEITIEY